MREKNGYKSDIYNKMEFKNIIIPYNWVLINALLTAKYPLPPKLAYF